MKLFDIILNKLTHNNASKVSAGIARERLQIIVAHHNNKHSIQGNDTMSKIKQDILNVLAKYYPTADFSNVNIQLEKANEQSMLQIDLTIPEHEIA